MCIGWVGGALQIHCGVQHQIKCRSTRSRIPPLQTPPNHLRYFRLLSLVLLKTEMRIFLSSEKSSGEESKETRKRELGKQSYQKPMNFLRSMNVAISSFGVGGWWVPGLSHWVGCLNILSIFLTFVSPISWYFKLFFFLV